MCKELPGPRCSNHASLKKIRALNSLADARRNFTTFSLEVKQAERAYYEANEEYKSTPDGLAHLKETEPTEYDHYKKIRDFQVDALNEVRNGRYDNMVKLVAADQTFYDEDEVRSVLMSTRKQEESKSLQNENIQTKDEQRNQYFSLLNQYEERLKNNHELTPEQQKALTILRQLPPPKESPALNAYSNFAVSLEKSKDSLKKEIQKVAIMQDVSTKVAEAYHDAYRNEYKEKYAHLPAKDQPNPPKEWVEGEFKNTGFQSDSTTQLAPSDPATMYAIYRLRSDPKAIPDYLKNSRIVASASFNAEMQQVAVVLFNNKGREVDRLVSSTSRPPHELADKLRGKIIVMDNDSASRTWLVDLNRKLPLNSSVLSTNELSSKHLNLPDNSLATLCQATNTTYMDSFEGKAETVLKAYFNSRQKIASKWQSKSPRRNAAPLENLPLTSRWA